MSLRNQLCKLICPKNLKAVLYTCHEGFPEFPSDGDIHFETELKVMYERNSSEGVWYRVAKPEFTQNL